MTAAKDCGTQNNTTSGLVYYIFIVPTFISSCYGKIGRLVFRPIEDETVDGDNQGNFKVFCVKCIT